MKDSIRTKLEAMISALREAPNVALLHAELGPPASDEDIARLQAWFDEADAAPLTALYRAANGVQVRWMSKHSKRYKAAPEKFAPGHVDWFYARIDGMENAKEDGVVLLPPIEVLLAHDWRDHFDGVEIEIDGEYLTDEDELAKNVLPFDWSHFYYLPSVFRADAKVRVGSDYGIDFDGPIRTVSAYVNDLVKSFGVPSPRMGRDGRFVKFAPKTAEQAAEQVAAALAGDEE
ncbi:MAG: hypothetical protein U0269_25335 [Polyangiales bacterium]